MTSVIVIFMSLVSKTTSNGPPSFSSLTTTDLCSVPSFATSNSRNWQRRQLTPFTLHAHIVRLGICLVTLGFITMSNYEFQINKRFQCNSMDKNEFLHCMCVVLPSDVLRVNIQPNIYSIVWLSPLSAASAIDATTLVSNSVYKIRLEKSYTVILPPGARRSIGGPHFYRILCEYVLYYKYYTFFLVFLNSNEI